VLQNHPRSNRAGRIIARNDYAPSRGQLTAMATRERRTFRQCTSGNVSSSPAASTISRLIHERYGSPVTASNEKAYQTVAVVRILEARVGFDGWRGRELSLEFLGVEEGRRSWN